MSDIPEAPALSRVLVEPLEHNGVAHRSAEELCEGLISDAASRQEAGSLADDQTVLVLRSTEGIVRKPKTLSEGKEE